MAKATKSPVPVNPLAGMIKEALKRREEAKMAKSQGADDGRDVRISAKPGTQDYFNEGRFIYESDKVRTRAKSAPTSRAEAIKEGFFTEKDGDLMPTAKYEEYKKSGKYSKFVK